MVASEWNPMPEKQEPVFYMQERPTDIILPIQEVRTTMSPPKAVGVALSYAAGGEVADVVLVTVAGNVEPPMLYTRRKGSKQYEVIVLRGLNHVHEKSSSRAPLLMVHRQR